jgi:TPR repeat
MDLHCPNCGGDLATSTPTAAPLNCTGCEKPVYFPHQGHFPPVVPLTFAPQAAASVPLIPFFHAEPSQVAPELRNGGDEEMQRTQEQNVPEELRRAAFPPDDVTPNLEVAPQLSRSFDDDDDRPDATVMTQLPNAEELKLLSLAGGSFAAAVTPPPQPADAFDRDAQPALAQMPGLTPPWELDGKGDPPQEHWSVASGPPPLTAGSQGPPKLKLPPPVPKKGSVDEIALSLGLPHLEDRPAQAPLSSLVLTQAPLEEEPPKSSKKSLLIIAISFVLVAAAAAVIAVATWTKELEKPLDPIPIPVIADPTPVKQPGAVKPEDPPKVENPKRTQAVELYKKGNKLYLQKKLKEAEAEFKRALDTDPTFALAYRGLGVTYALQEKNQKAIEAYKSYLKHEPDAKDANLVRKIIKEAEQQK